MKIGISKTDSNFHRYCEWLEYNKVNYCVLDYKEPEKGFKDFEECSALILTGGVDIYPEIYCDWDTAETRGTYKPERDGFEMKLMDIAIGRKMPVLGICRGCQFINVYLRGSLIFDLPSIRNVHHEKIEEKKDRWHQVNIFHDTLLYEILGEESFEVNSAHHQAVDRLGESLRVSAKAPDGVIESVEYSDYKHSPFLLGIMWHPERFENYESAASKKLITRLINEAEAFKI